MLSYSNRLRVDDTQVGVVNSIVPGQENLLRFHYQAPPGALQDRRHNGIYVAHIFRPAELLQLLLCNLQVDAYQVIPVKVVNDGSRFPEEIIHKCFVVNRPQVFIAITFGLWAVDCCIVWPLFELFTFRYTPRRWRYSLCSD